MERNGFCIYEDAELKTQHRLKLLARVLKDCENYLNDLLERCAALGIKYETEILRFREICSHARNGKRFDYQTSIATSEELEEDIKVMPKSGSSFAKSLQTLVDVIQQKCRDIFPEKSRVNVVNLGCVSSLPGAPEQHFHSDGRRKGMINAFVALHEVDMLQGPTDFIIGSHEFVHNAPYVNTKTRKKQEKAKRVCLELKRGDILFYDYRILHRGRKNATTST